MGVISNFLKIFLLLELLAVVSAETYSVKIGTERHVNVVSKNFLSFTVDPKYLFSTSEKHGGEKIICMASSLAPAYLRIAGPSTSLLNFHNSTITIDDSLEVELDEIPRKTILDNFLGRGRKRQGSKVDSSEETHRKNKDLDDKSRKFFSNLLGKISNQKSGDADTDFSKNLKKGISKSEDGLQVSSDMWKRFAKWAKVTGFEIVFALNNDEKSASGVWDPNMALDILSVAEKEDVDDIYWQLGYECTNQSIDDYLNDLETLRVIVETFPQGKEKRWRVAGSDVTGCLREDSKSDFKDYVALSLDIADALVLNGNSSSYELERLSPPDRSKLLRLIHASGAPLWVTRRQQALSALPRAAAWMGSLGHAARRGAHAHFTDLTEDDLYRPSLSFYMALLFKNLVGERVLDVDIESSHTILFAHCTSLRHQPVPGAVTLYGVNMDDEPARLSIKLNRREEGGDILQFILSENEDGNIVVNGREMSQEGDIRPVVRRVRPYKTLFLNLPAESIGFWVIANTKIDACQYIDETNEENIVKAESIEVRGNSKIIKDRQKRSIINEGNKHLNNVENPKAFDEFDVVKTGNNALDKRLANLNKYLREIHNVLGKMRTNQVNLQEFEQNQTTTTEAALIEIQKNPESIKIKYVESQKNDEISNADAFDVVKTGNKPLDKRIANLNKHLREIHDILGEMRANELTRQTFEENQINKREAEFKEIQNNPKIVENRKKRSLGNDDTKNPNNDENSNTGEFDVVKTGNKALDQRLANLNKYLREIHNILGKMRTNKVKRQTFEENQTTKKLRRQLLQIRRDFKKIDGDTKPILGFIGNLLQLTRNSTIPNDRLRNHLILHRSRISRLPSIKDIQNKEKNNLNRQERYQVSKKYSRARRSIINDKNDIIHYDNQSSVKENEIDVENKRTVNDEYDSNVSKDFEKLAKENEIDVDDKENKTIWRILHNIQKQLNKISGENSLKNETVDEKDLKTNVSEKLIFETEVTDDSATIHFEEEPKTGWMKSTFENIFFALNNLNDSLNRFWEALSIFE